MSRPFTLVATAVVAALLLGGCASLSRMVQRASAQRTGELLAAAGFEIEPTNTAAKLAGVRREPPFELVRRSDGDEVRYTYADPVICTCRYVGNARQYAQYQRLRVGQRIAEAEMGGAWLDQDVVLNRDFQGRRWW